MFQAFSRLGRVLPRAGPAVAAILAQSNVYCGKHEGVGHAPRLQTARDGCIEVSVEHRTREALLEPRAEPRRGGGRGHVRRRQPTRRRAVQLRR